MYYRPHAQAPASPVTALPVELLAYIFVLGTHDPSVLDGEHDDGCQAFNSDSVKTPLVYGRVCRHWRNVALNTPALYTSLCITPELLREVGAADVLDTAPISSYLALSRNYLVDILIDARDQEWDFNDDGTYVPWFTPEHMGAAMAVLLPHLGRWRSLSILTDLYAPMHAALCPLEAHLTAYGAPHLASLRLMRCDAYAAHAPLSPVPNPADVFLASVPPDASLLPNLRHLALLGVPAAWGPLAALLPPTLHTLELAYHPAPAQPTVPALAALLSAAPHLARLTLNGSGPALPAAADPPAPRPVPLAHLSALTLGYVSTPAGLALLSLVHAPRLRALTLEDAGDPAAPLPVNATPLLTLLYPSGGAHKLAAPLFPALAHLTLRRAHLAPTPAAAPILAVPQLTLVDMAPAAVAQTLYGPGVVEVHAEGSAPSQSDHAPEPEEFRVGATRVRVFHSPAPYDDDDDNEGDASDDSDPETLLGFPMDWEEAEAAAFKVGGAFNDPVFDARWGV
ncbi:hypothetical protein B0H17DRAFT_1332346 [Mycena rosella]|uniref:F-box domain-containing protein n=1 Tax=Mycena rosella TaxID=1033263 RepID=A0AAD7GEU7_MYCRO|nr:hypothetical protein B0H17DRAFT_1332346 [Mycena rosella]